MELNRVLVYLVSAWCLLSLWRFARASLRQYRGWIIVSLSVLAAMAVAHPFLPEGAGFVGLGLWGGLYMAPALGMQRLNRLILAGRYDAAERLACVLRWLHPADGWREQPDLVRSMALASRGRTAEAAEVLSRHGAAATSLGRAAAIQVMRLEGRWADLRDRLAADLEREELRRDRVSVVAYVRALGETGDPAGALEALGRLRPYLESSGALNRETARLAASAFAGRSQLVERLLGGPLAVLGPGAREYWLGTAAFAAGRREEALAWLERALDSADELAKAAIGRRLSSPPPAAEGLLTPGARDVLARLERDLDEEERYGSGVRAGAAIPCTTYALVAANLAFFAAEIALGGSESPLALYRLGALVPEGVLAAGEWWRVPASAFLHFGPVHLALNMFALLVLGPFTERSLGAARFATVYLASMLGAAGLYLASAGSGDAGMAVGASGCIMGLVGATAAVLLRGWWTEGARVARRRLAWIGVILVVQVVFDVLTPQVSMSMHWAGMAAGLAAGVALYRPRVPATSRAAAAPPDA